MRNCGKEYNHKYLKHVLNEYINVDVPLNVEMLIVVMKTVVTVQFVYVYIKLKSYKQGKRCLR